MAFSHKIISLVLCVMLASFCAHVEAGHGMMGGMMGGGGGKHGGGSGGIEALLAAGLLAKILRNQGHGHHHHHGHHEHHEHHGRIPYGGEMLGMGGYGGGYGMGAY